MYTLTCANCHTPMGWEFRPQQYLSSDTMAALDIYCPDCCGDEFEADDPLPAPWSPKEETL